MRLVDQINIENDKFNDNFNDDERIEDGEFLCDNEEIDKDTTFTENNHSIIFKGKNNTIFHLKIPYNKYLKIKQSLVEYKNKCQKRNYNVLKQKMWTDVINDAFLSKYKLPCNFIFKRNKVAVDTLRGQYFITFNAKCKDKGCSLFGWSKNKPDKGQPLRISTQAMDTRGQESEHTRKRPLKGMKRIEIGKNLSNDFSCNWRRNNVSNMKFGQISPPNLCNLEVLRKTKQEYKDKVLNITKKYSLKSLVELKYNSQFSGSIHSIGIDSFFVHY